MANWGRISTRGNVIDRRGMAYTAAGGISVAGFLLVVGFNLLTGGNLGDIVSQLQYITPNNTSQRQEFAGEDSYEEFAAKVLGSANEFWNEAFQDAGISYVEPSLVLFRGLTESGCGTASSQVGPHYCPRDERIYLDETFFDELESRLGARGGDVAEAYVIAHEVGHHVQNLSGDLSQLTTQSEAIAIELQADCYAGLWASSIKEAQIFEPNEISEAMDAAEAVGDDNIQERVEGRINPEVWNHGSSEQRLQAFLKGYNSGEVSQCDLSNFR